MSEENKIVLKNTRLPGVDLSLHDIYQVSSVRTHKTVVVEKMFKKGKSAYIGIKENAESGEIIQTGNLGLKYRIMGATVKVLPYGGYRFKVKRVDGFNITLTDIDAISVGDKVKFKSRRNFIQIMNYPPIEGFGTNSEDE